MKSEARLSKLKAEEIHKRRVKAFEYREKGLSFEEIAVLLGKTRGWAHQASVIIREERKALDKKLDKIK